MTLYELSVNDFITFLKDFINLLNDDFRIKYLKFYSFALVFSPPPPKKKDLARKRVHVHGYDTLD